MSPKSSGIRHSTLFILVLLLCSRSWAGNASFQLKTTPAGDVGSIVTADLNGDGIPDLIELGASLRCNCFSVQLGHSDGTFAPPVNHVFSFLNQGLSHAITADLNHDGKADVVVTATTGGGPFQTHVLVYLGNGDGTLAEPTDITFDGGNQFMVAADFNHDGNVDLALDDVVNNIENIVVMNGDGRGGFSAPAQLFSLGSSDHGINSMAVGDFDADAHADIALSITNAPCNPGLCSSSTVQVLYGSGTGTFTDVTEFSTNGDIAFSAGDVNGDGRTDLVGILDEPAVAGKSVVVLYGSSSRTMTSTFLAPIGQPVFRNASVPVITDFNGDLHNDFAIPVIDPSNRPSIDLFLGSSSGSFTVQEIVVAPWQSNLVLGDFDRNRKPDFVFASGTSGTGATATIENYLNETSGGHFNPCSLPATSHGIHKCTPFNGATMTSPVRFAASGDWFQTIRKMELWVDGAKLGEQHFGWDQAAWFDLTRQLSAGSHKATFFSAGYDNQLQSLTVSFAVSGTESCSHPSTVGVHVCSPLNGSIDGSPVLALASATVTGTISRMEVWVDGVKKFTVTGTTTLKTSLAVPSGTHQFAFFAVNTAGTKWLATSTITVK
jgi:hypothetical protein